MSQSTAVTRPKRPAPPTAWKPGQSGNPGGREKSIDIAALARRLGPRALEALSQALDDPKSRVAAAVALLDRGFGRPVQPIAGESPAGELTVLHLIAARQVAEAMQALLEGRKPDAPTNGAAEPPVIDLSVPALE